MKSLLLAVAFLSPLPALPCGDACTEPTPRAPATERTPTPSRPLPGTAQSGPPTQPSRARVSRHDHYEPVPCGHLWQVQIADCQGHVARLSVRADSSKIAKDLALQIVVAERRLAPGPLRIVRCRFIY